MRAKSTGERTEARVAVCAIPHSSKGMQFVYPASVGRTMDTYKLRFGQILQARV